jgi:hypothetical protein
LDKIFQDIDLNQDSVSVPLKFDNGELLFDDDDVV